MLKQLSELEIYVPYSTYGHCNLLFLNVVYINFENKLEKSTFLYSIPRFVVNYDSLSLESQNQAKNIPELTNQNLRQIGPGVREF